MSGEYVSRLKSSYKRSKGDATEKTCSFCGGSKKHADRNECQAWTAKYPCRIPHYFQHLCKRKVVPPTKKTVPSKPTNKADTSGTEENQVEPANLLTEPFEYMFNIGHIVTKRCSSRQLLHMARELSSLFISKMCLQELGIISDSFPLPKKLLDSVDAVGKPTSSTPSYQQHHVAVQCIHQPLEFCIPDWRVLGP